MCGDKEADVYDACLFVALMPLISILFKIVSSCSSCYIKRRKIENLIIAGDVGTVAGIIINFRDREIFRHKFSILQSLFPVLAVPENELQTVYQLGHNPVLDFASRRGG